MTKPPHRASGRRASGRRASARRGNRRQQGPPGLGRRLLAVAQQASESARGWWVERRALRSSSKALAGLPGSRRKAALDPDARARGVRRRMGFAAAVVLALFGAALFRSWSLQIDQREWLAREAQRNYMRTAVLESRRGEILDRSGDRLATSVQVDTVVADPTSITDPEATAAALSAVLSDVTYDTLSRRLRKSTSQFAYVKRRVSEREAAAVQALGLDGVSLIKEWRRFYPRRELGGQVLGRVGVDAVGLEGVERALEPVLKLGEDATESEQSVHGVGRVRVPYVRDYRGRSAYMSGIPDDLAPQGLSAQLTIDATIQAEAERIIADGVTRHGAVGGMAVVMDVPTGEILAMANVPTYNPNTPRSFPVATWRNRTIKDVFEPGSTFKIFSLAAVLDAGKARLDETIDTENGRLKIGKHTIRDIHRAKEMTVREVIAHSSNIGITKLTSRIGKRALKEALEEFGFGEPTGVAFDAEPRGIMQPLSKWADITFANVSFGQGIAVTALQLTRAVAALGNDGKLMKPLLVKRVLASDGRVLHEVQPEVVRQVIRPSTAKQVIAAMMACASPEGSGEAAMISGYTVAGKTGTAQKAVTPESARAADGTLRPTKGGYLEDAWMSSFVGLVPAERPRLAILVLIDEPIGHGYGGQVAAPLFREIATAALERLGIGPSLLRPIKSAKGSVNELLGALAAQTNATSEPLAVDVETASSCEVPDLLGLAAASASRRATNAGFVVELDGTGLVVNQSAAPGRRLDCGARLALRLDPADARMAASPRPGAPASASLPGGAP